MVKQSVLNSNRASITYVVCATTPLRGWENPPPRQFAKINYKGLQCGRLSVQQNLLLTFNCNISWSCTRGVAVHLYNFLEVGGQRRALPPNKRRVKHPTKGSARLGAGLDGTKYPRLHLSSNPGPSSPWRVAIPTTPSRPPLCYL
jgi:hypothetical protein